MKLHTHCPTAEIQKAAQLTLAPSTLQVHHKGVQLDCSLVAQYKTPSTLTIHHPGISETKNGQIIKSISYN